MSWTPNFSDYDIWKTTDPRDMQEERYDEEEEYNYALETELLRWESMQEYEQIRSAGWIMFEMQC